MAETPPDPQAAGSPSAAPNAFSPSDALQFIQSMWNPFGVPVPGLPIAAAPPIAAPAGGGMGIGMPSPASLFMSLDPAEIERKIGELRVIENWLQMSLNFMQMSIKTMELQKASLEALRGATQAASTPPAEDKREKHPSRGSRAGKGSGK